MDKPLNILSLGAGVQSTTMALMAAHGEITPMPDCAIFADTGGEPQSVYDHLKWLMSPNVLPFEVHIVRRGDLLDDCLKNVRGEIETGKRSTIPAFTLGKDGRAAPLTRQCTRDYKIDPIILKCRELLGSSKGRRVPKGARCVQWIGISTDEILRAKPSRQAWIDVRWPLIEASMNRNDCLRWMERNGYPTPPKSSCTFCPYHSNAKWRDMKDNDPESWRQAVEFDQAIRSGFKGSRGEVFLHRDLKPLEDVDLSTAEERGQGDMFINHCEEGMCGV